MNYLSGSSSLEPDYAWGYMKNRHGFALPLSSIRVNNGHGIGEYLDLIPLIDWCKETHFEIIQLLPLNDSGHDPSPYSAHSAMALHPIYLSLDIKAADSNSKRVNYQEILKAKETFLKSYIKEILPDLTKRKAYRDFLQEKWLDGYARYKTLKAINDEKAWWDWSDIPSELPEDIVEHHKAVQFLCFEQMQEVKKRADEVGIAIKGDIPILINRDSADVWQHPELFNLDYAAGAPPDYYSEDGQYWGFPLYRWDILEKSNFQWWKERLKVAEKLYQMYRLDHIVGFYRIWAIPEGVSAKFGHFEPDDSLKWVPQGSKIMNTLLETSPMIPIGEDLGDVPTEVRKSLAELGIAGTKVMRWERNWQGDKSFIDPKAYPQLSMTSLSTHDSEPLEVWWDSFPEDAESFCKACNIPYTALLTPETRKAVLEASHTSGSRYHINLLFEYLDVFDDLTWQDPNDDRINIPGKVLDRNWTYRMLPTLDQIIAHNDLKALMQSLAN